MSSRLRQWLDDGNVVVLPCGHYTTQCSQYTNLLTLRELVAFFVREYGR